MGREAGGEELRHGRKCGGCIFVKALAFTPVRAAP